MKLQMSIDGAEEKVNATLVELTCPNCEHVFDQTPMDLLREAEVAHGDSSEAKQAKEVFVTYYLTTVTCGECAIPFPVDFAYGEMQPGRYVFGMYQ